MELPEKRLRSQFQVEHHVPFHSAPAETIPLQRLKRAVTPHMHRDHFFWLSLRKQALSESVRSAVEACIPGKANRGRDIKPLSIYPPSWAPVNTPATLSF